MECFKVLSAMTRRCQFMKALPSIHGVANSWSEARIYDTPSVNLFMPKAVMLAIFEDIYAIKLTMIAVWVILLTNERKVLCT